MASELREKTVSGMIWSAIERFGSSFFLFIANLVLARLLTPDDFGAVAMLMVFISLSEIIVDAGFSSALIQKQDADKRDYSTIYIWNIIFGVILYSTLFFSAPIIARFYNISILKNILRIQGLVIPLNSFILVHIAYLKKQLKFKKITQINLLAIIIGTVVGIITAFLGAGVWSLIIKILLTAIVQMICYYGIRCWKPSFIFDFTRFKSMFRFGGFIFIEHFTNSLYYNLLALIIGKRFNAATLGCYNQARKLEDVPRSVLSSIVTNVTFPVFSLINTDIKRFKEAASKCMRSLSFLAVPFMLYAIVVAKPLFIVLFTNKWIEAVPYFQILCMGGLIITPTELNISLLNAIGKSRLSFYLRLSGQVAGLCLLFLGISFGMKGLLAAYVIGMYLSFILAGIYSGKYIRYGLWRQIKDMLPFFLASVVSGCIAILPAFFITSLNNLWLLLIQTSLFILVYYIISKLFRFEEIKTYRSIIKSKLKRR